MSAKFNDVCPLHDATGGRMSIALKCPIRFAFDMTVWSDIIVLGMMDKLLTRSCLFQLLFYCPSFHLQCVLQWVGRSSKRFDASQTKEKLIWSCSEAFILKGCSIPASVSTQEISGSCLPQWRLISNETCPLSVCMSVLLTARLVKTETWGSNAAS